DYVDRHDNHGDDTYPLAHHPVTSHYVRGPVRFPVDLRLYRRYEELTRWAAFVHKHFPDRLIPTQKKERARLHKAVDAILLADPDFEKLHQQFRTKMDLGIAVLESAIPHKVPFRVLLFDSWYLAEALVSMARYRDKDLISLLQKHRNLVTNRVDWSAQRIIALYVPRWPRETFYQDGKTHLGLDEDRMRNAEAIGKHWCLVFVAYALLPLDCLPPSPTKGSLPVKTIGEACRQQAQALIQALILSAHEQLQRGQKAAD